MTNRWSLLLISDLHFEDPDANFEDDPKELNLAALRNAVFPQLDAILNDGFEKESFDLIAVTGDITTHGRPEGFDKFVQIYPQMRQLVKKEEAICIVPGNHDVLWGLDPTASNSFNHKFENFAAMVEKCKATSCLYPQGKLTEDPNDVLVLRPLANGPIFHWPERKLVVACINSAIRCGELNGAMQAQVAQPAQQALQELKGLAADPAVGSRVQNVLANLEQMEKSTPRYLIRDVAHVTQAQLSYLSRELGKLKKKIGDNWSSYLRVALLHHHLLHFRGQIIEHRGYELLMDSGSVLDVLTSFDFDLALTGHKHQPYVERYHAKEKEILLVGGPTVAGHSAGESFRGIRRIEIEDQDEYRSFAITDIANKMGNGNVRENIESLEPSIEKCPRGRQATWEQRLKRTGFFYRELASITLLGEDGDARRIVECEDLVVQKNGLERASFHPVKLPSTSGYLAELYAEGREFLLDVESKIPRDARASSWETRLVFSEEVGTDSPASYAYRWYAVNAFAMDKQQFTYKYPNSTGQHNIEFTHFSTTDPIQDFTLVVQFPPGFRLKQPPRLRIALVNPQSPDARTWKVDGPTQRELTQTHALRFYESLNIAALRVQHPQPSLSYGIQWEVPDPPSTSPQDQLKIQHLRNTWNSSPLNEVQKRGLLDVLARIIKLTRRSILPHWTGPLDASLMYFDGKSELSMLLAAREQKVYLQDGETQPVQEESMAVEYETSELLYQNRPKLRYGDGIAGRAFKANRVSIYVSSERPENSEEPDFYTYLPNDPKHEVLVALPVHLPEPEDRLKKDSGAYRNKAPYGVFNLGSQRPDCPLASLRFPENEHHAVWLQHFVNRMISQRVRELFFR